jgi:hypothetical protein
MITQSARVAGVAVDLANRSKDDWYPTPLEATRGLLRVEKFTGSIWEPACGDGAISCELIAAGYEVDSTDLVDRGYGTHGVDFLMEWQARGPNIVTNPPFKLVTPFVLKALDMTTDKMALLLRLACLEGAERREIFETTPLARVWVFSKRLQFKRPGWTDTGAGGMTAYAWFVWEHGHRGPPTLGWI